MPRLFIMSLTGPPGCGKSTFARIIKKRLPEYDITFQSQTQTKNNLKEVYHVASFKSVNPTLKERDN